DLSFDVRRLRDRIGRLVERAAAVSGKQPAGPLLRGISHEALAGDWPAGKNSRFIARALRQAFPDARIVLVVRQQRGMLTSAHRQYVRQGGTANFQQFLMDPYVSRGVLRDDLPLNTHVVEFCKYS